MTVPDKKLFEGTKKIKFQDYTTNSGCRQFLNIILPNFGWLQKLWLRCQDNTIMCEALASFASSSKRLKRTRAYRRLQNLVGSIESWQTLLLSVYPHCCDMPPCLLYLGLWFQRLLPVAGRRVSIFACYAGCFKTSALLASVYFVEQQNKRSCGHHNEPCIMKLLFQHRASDWSPHGFKKTCRKSIEKSGTFKSKHSIRRLKPKLQSTSKARRLCFKSFQILGLHIWKSCLAN